MIESIEIRNIRGITGRIELDPKTLITGENGVGKSAYLAGAHFDFMGRLPGYQAKETFANASGQEMYTKVLCSGRIVERKLTQGKTLSEELAIDGTWAKAKGGDARLRDAFGPSPKLLDMPGFFACTDTQKRRMLLGMVCDREKVSSLTEKEEGARKAKNAATSERRTADKAVEELTKQKAGIEKPIGNLAHMQDEKQELDRERKEVMQRVATGKANDEARKMVEKAVSNKDSAENLVKELKEKAKTRNAAVKKLVKAIAEHQADAPEEIRKPVFGPGIVEKIEDALSQVNMIIEKKGVADEFVGNMIEVSDTLCSIFPDPEMIKVSEKAMKEWREAADAFIASHAGAEKELKKVQRELGNAKAELKSIVKAAKQHEKIGPGLDTNDVSSLEGIERRIAELDEKIKPLQEIAALDKSIETARVNAEKALREEESAKAELDKAVREQRAVVEAAAEKLARLSKEVLPYGNLRLEIDEKNLYIYWAKNKGTKVQRTTLSGGEQALFDCALGHAMAPEASIVIEGAEIDDKNIVAVMEHLGQFDFQVILATCHTPPSVPNGWTHIKM